MLLVVARLAKPVGGGEGGEADAEEVEFGGAGVAEDCGGLLGDGCGKGADAAGSYHWGGDEEGIYFYLWCGFSCGCG